MRHAHLCGGRGVAGLVCAGPATLPDARPIACRAGDAGDGDHLLQLLHHPDQHPGSAGFYRRRFAPDRAALGAVFCRPSVQAGARLFTLPLWASSTSYCCGSYGIRRALSGLPTYFCMTSFRWDTSCTGCCLPARRIALEGCRSLAGLSRRLPGVHAGAGSGERALSLSICGRECAGLWRRSGPGRGIFAGISGNGLTGRGGGPLDARAPAR